MSKKKDITTEALEEMPLLDEIFREYCQSAGVYMKVKVMKDEGQYYLYTKVCNLGMNDWSGFPFDPEECRSLDKEDLRKYFNFPKPVHDE